MKKIYLSNKHRKVIITKKNDDKKTCDDNPLQTWPVELMNFSFVA